MQFYDLGERDFSGSLARNLLAWTYFTDVSLVSLYYHLYVISNQFW